MLERISVLNHASVKLTGEKFTVYIDPYGLSGAPHDADLILVTHSHFDHLSPEDIEKVRKPGAALVLPASEGAQAGGLGFGGEDLLLLKPGGRGAIRGVEIEGVASYNRNKPNHPKSNGWLGYVVTLNGLRYYIAGDTDDTPEARSVKCDVALVPVGGTYTTDAEEAAALVNAIRPRAAVPIHYGSIVGSQKDAERFLALLAPGIEGKRLL